MMLDSQEIDALAPATVADLNAFASWPLEAQRIAARVMRSRFEAADLRQFDCDGCYKRGLSAGEEQAAETIEQQAARIAALHKELDEVRRG